MSWNYRILKNKLAGRDICEIHEVYYNSDGSVKGWTQNSIIPTGETPEELKQDLTMMLQAFESPVLDLDQLVKACSEKR